MFISVFGGGAKTGDISSGISTSTFAMLLMATDDKGREWSAIFDIKCADTNWAANFVGRDSRIIDI